jgi:hypothetical protein
MYGTAAKEFSMKNKFKLIGIIALLAVIGFSMAACGDNSSSDPDLFEGTWVGSSDDGSVRIVAAGGKFTIYLNGTEGMRGTYTASGNTVNGKYTEINLSAFGLPGSWTKVSDLPPDIKTQLGGENIAATLNGNTLTMEGMTFTKQP